MEWIEEKNKVLEKIKKYRYIILLLLVGLLMMNLPQSPEEEEGERMEQSPEVFSLQDALECILSKISGAGQVEVLLTQAEGEQILYQTDEDISERDTRQNTVLVTDNTRTETGLIRQVNPPIYLGAIVLCQGADNARVRLSIVEAVMSVTGLTSDHITVLKMK